MRGPFRFKLRHYHGRVRWPLDDESYKTCLLRLQTWSRVGVRVPGVMTEHVPTDRLLEVVADHNLIFSLEEFNHLLDCSACFSRWSQFVYATVVKDARLQVTLCEIC